MACCLEGRFKRCDNSCLQPAAHIARICAVNQKAC